MSVVPYSVLDLVPVPEGGLPAESFRHSLDLARHAERWGYHRYWLAEHHNMPGIASAATAVLIGHLAGGTTTLRLGAGGIMLPNHSPLVIAEQFGTLSSLYPDRIDLGLGRAPGSDQRTMQALRRQRSGEVDDFPADVRELMSYFGDEVGAVQAVPGQGLHVPIWLLGSSLYSAQLAAAMGLPFGFASHFAPAMLLQALEIYRTQYRPSARWPKPHAVVCVNLIAADTDREARFLFQDKYLKDADAVLAMYHDQGLPVLKYKGFGNSVNITLGLPFIRTSVDHGTALDLAGKGLADPGSLITAINHAIQMVEKKRYEQ